MSTHRLLLRLSDFAQKTEYLNHINNELDNTIQQLQNVGYNINKSTGLVGRQSFNNANDIVLFWHFRELHFMYNGLLNNVWTYDTADKLYFLGLQGFVTNQYENLP